MASKKDSKFSKNLKKPLPTETEDEYAESEFNEGQYDDEVETDVEEGFEESFSNDEVEDEDKLNDNIEIEDEKDKDKSEFEEDDECFYKYAEESDDEYFEEENIDDLKNKKELKGDDRISRPILFDDERIRILGDRTKQLSLSAKCMVKGVEDLPPLTKAELEIEHGVCPLLIERDMCNGYFEVWRINELKR